MKMSKSTWKTILEIVAAIVAAALTALGGAHAATLAGL